MVITKGQIIEATEALKASGVNPSMAAVREKLGGGSFATISPVLREWRELQEQRAVVAIEMPAERDEFLKEFEKLEKHIDQIIASLQDTDKLKAKIETLELQSHKLQISPDASVKASDELKVEIKH